MGIDIKKMLADSLLKLCENKNLEALTIQDL